MDFLYLGFSVDLVKKQPQRVLRHPVAVVGKGGERGSEQMAPGFITETNNGQLARNIDRQLLERGDQDQGYLVAAGNISRRLEVFIVTDNRTFTVFVIVKIHFDDIGVITVYACIIHRVQKTGKLLVDR